MRSKLLIGLFTASLALAACGGYGSDDAQSVANTDEPASAPADAPEGADVGAAVSAAAVQISQTALGEVLANGEGFSLYGFMNDTGGVPTCEDTCAETWPPVLVDSTDLPAGLDPAIFRVAPRPDGTLQLAAGSWPLYTYAGDAAPGETNGQGTGGVWYVVTPTGQLNQGDDAPAPPAEDPAIDYGS
jgi:predicted lipoprotein with Yx(FWY)xxD motif